jgi:hypothetical protein
MERPISRSDLPRTLRQAAGRRVGGCEPEIRSCPQLAHPPAVAQSDAALDRLFPMAFCDAAATTGRGPDFLVANPAATGLMTCATAIRLGIAEGPKVVTADEPDAIEDIDFQMPRSQHSMISAGTSSELKRRLVRVLRADDLVIAMTGRSVLQLSSPCSY